LRIEEAHFELSKCIAAAGFRGLCEVGIVDSQETTLELKRNKFDWEDLQIFHAVATTGSMSAAAAALGCQQPTVSKRMRQLEARLGAILIERRAGGIALTPAGETALEYARTMQRSAQQLESRVSGQDRAAEGEVTLRVPDGLATYWLARHLPRFMQINPAIHLNVTNGPGGAGQSRAADLGITFVPEKKMDVHARALGSMHFMPVASREFINTYGAPSSAHDALNLRFLKLRQYNRDLELWGHRAAAVDAYINYAFETDVSSVLFETLRQGGGIAMVPTYLIALHSTELVVLDYDFQQDVRFWLKYSPENQHIGRIKCVGDWIEEVFDNSKNPWFRNEFCHPREFCDVDVITPQQ
jgi:DNA-binding transcriptional LysR family regulator